MAQNYSTLMLLELWVINWRYAHYNFLPRLLAFPWSVCYILNYMQCFLDPKIKIFKPFYEPLQTTGSVAECWSRCSDVETSLCHLQEEWDTHSDCTCSGHPTKSPKQASSDQKPPVYELWQLEATLLGHFWWLRWSIYHVISVNHFWYTSWKAQAFFWEYLT